MDETSGQSVESSGAESAGQTSDLSSDDVAGMASWSLDAVDAARAKAGEKPLSGAAQPAEGIPASEVSGEKKPAVGATEKDIFDMLLAEEEAPVEAQGEQKPAAPALPPEVSQRFQQYEAAIQQTGAQLQQMQQYIQSQQQERAALDRALAVAQRELELARSAREAETTKNMSALDQIEHAAAKRAEERMTQIMQRTTQAMQQRYDAHINQLTEKIAARERQENIGKWQSKAETVVGNLTQGFKDSPENQHLKSMLSAFVLNWSAMRNADPEVGAKDFDELATKYVVQKLRGRAAAMKAKSTAGSKVPAPAGSGGRASGGVPAPSDAQIAKAGFKDRLAYEMAMRSRG